MQAALSKGKLIRAEQVAELIGVSPQIANTLMKQMPRINIGTSLQRPRWAVYEADVQAWLNSRQLPAETPNQPKRRTKRTASITMLNGLLDEHGHIPRRK